MGSTNEFAEVIRGLEAELVQAKHQLSVAGKRVREIEAEIQDAKDGLLNALLNESVSKSGPKRSA